MPNETNHFPGDKLKVVLSLMAFFSFLSSRVCKCVCLYGEKPCDFLPAPPGRSPPCARPGATYCEHVPHYPGQLISYLLEKWRYDHATLLSDESRDDFSTYFHPPTDHYNNAEPWGHPANALPHDSYLPERNSAYFHGGNFTGYPDRRTRFHNSNANNQIWGDGTNFYSQRRLARSERSRGTEDSRRRDRQTPEMSTNATDTSEAVRTKRQSALNGGQTLCRSASQYIMPRAALNNKGNWMFVVNMPQLNNRYTQLVKSETCLTQSCSGICSLPDGYASRCEQKYVQKRLVALEGAGNRLYNDLFWFPSCCVCTITNN